MFYADDVAVKGGKSAADLAFSYCATYFYFMSYTLVFLLWFWLARGIPYLMMHEGWWPDPKALSHDSSSQASSLRRKKEATVLIPAAFVLCLLVIPCYPVGSKYGIGDLVRGFDVVCFVLSFKAFFFFSTITFSRRRQPL